MATALPTKESGTYEEPSSTTTTATCTHRSQLSPPTFADRPDPPWISSMQYHCPPFVGEPVPLSVCSRIPGS